MIPAEQLKKVLEDHFDGGDVQVVDLTGTQDHYQVRIVSSAFEGQRPIARHRMVYGALGSLMDAAVHALTMETLTPAEAGKES